MCGGGCDKNEKNEASGLTDMSDKNKKDCGDETSDYKDS